MASENTSLQELFLHSVNKTTIGSKLIRATVDVALQLMLLWSVFANLFGTFILWWNASLSRATLRWEKSMLSSTFFSILGCVSLECAQWNVDNGFCSVETKQEFIASNVTITCHICDSVKSDSVASLMWLLDFQMFSLFYCQST